MVEQKKKQTMRYNDSELSLMKVFSDNDELIMALRKVFLQMPLDTIDLSVVVGFFKDKKELLDLMKKSFNPTLDPNAPIHQLIDLWMTIEVKDKSIEELQIVFASRKLLIDLLNQQLRGLETISNGEVPKYRIDINKLATMENKTVEQFYIDIMTRNSLITHVETRLSELALLAGTKEETVEQTKDRLRKNSSK